MTDQQGPGWDGGMTQPGRVPEPQDTPPPAASPWPSTQYAQSQWDQGQPGSGQYGPGQAGQNQWGQGTGAQNQWGQNQYGQNQWPQGQYAPGQYAPGMAAPYGGQRTNPMAIAAIVCGGAQLFFGLLTGIPAIILGHLARRQIRQTGENGAGLALAGLILGYVGVAICALLIVFIVVIAVAASHHAGSFSYNSGG
jgi:hypothetical protein